MAVFPLFVELKKKKCLVVGGGMVAERKIESLLKFDAGVVVVSPEINERLEQLKWEGKITVIRKKYSDEDLIDVFLVIAATNKAEVNEKVYRDAVARNILINTVDCPEKCTFLFPSVVKRGNLVIGISTSGSYPALSKSIREKLEGIFPKSYGEILSVLKEARRMAEKEVNDPEERKQFLYRILDEVLTYEDSLTIDQLKARVQYIFEGLEHDKKD